jgi:hypothetical protein
MLDNAYALTFDPALKAIFTNYIASAKSNNARTEYTFLKYPAFYYFGLRTVEDITSEFSRRGRQLTEKADSYRRKKPPESGDDLRARFTPYPSGMEYIAGSLWGRYDNGRCGGPVPGSIRYFAGRGQPGLPLNIAALVTRVGKEHVEVLFYNRDTKPVSVFLVAGWYGQHNWTNVTTSGGVDKRISARTVKLVLGPGASGSVKLGIDRFVYPPVLILYQALCESVTVRNTGPSPFSSAVNRTDPAKLQQTEDKRCREVNPHMSQNFVAACPPCGGRAWRVLLKGANWRNAGAAVESDLFTPLCEKSQALPVPCGPCNTS